MSLARTLTRLTPLILSALALAGCPDDPKLPLGATCGDDSECAEGQCLSGFCLEPEGDADLDGLTNAIEGALGTNPTVTDSDGDGVADPDEVADVSNPKDSDGDGKLDANESASTDADADCVHDQVDPDDGAPEVDPAKLARLVCRTVGACGAEGAVVTASCPDGETPTCDYGQVPEFEASEMACDGVDNDCDGATDERHAAGGEVSFDGGPFAGDAGKALGASCGAGACAGGTVVCAIDKATLVCSSSDRAGPLTCDADVDCDGTPDEAQVADPLTTPLAGCVDHFQDVDGDQHGAGEAKCLCAPAGGYTLLTADDCAPSDDAIHPGATGICGVDADCDEALRDTDEACDDGNDVIDDGCHACQVVAKQLGGEGLYPGEARVVALVNGGFAIAWHQGPAGDAQPSEGRVIAFFSADGVEVRRHTGLGATDPQVSERTALAALRGGGVAHGYWRFALESEGWFFEVQRYDDDGAPRGEPIVMTGPAEASWDFGIAPTAPGAFAGWWVRWSVNQQIELVIHHVDATGKLADKPAGRAFEGSAGSFQALGFVDGEVLASWAEYAPVTYEELHMLQRFGVDGAPGTPFELDPEELHPKRRVLLVPGPGDDGWAAFFLEDRNTTEPSTRPTGYVRFDADDAPIGARAYVQETDTEGCPYELVGGFDAAGDAFTGLSDGECRSPVRAHLVEGGQLVTLDLADPKQHPETSGLAAASAGGPTFVFRSTRDTGLSALYLKHFRGSRAEYLPTPR